MTCWTQRLLRADQAVLRYDDFTVNTGRPIKKNKLLLFFGARIQEDQQIHQPDARDSPTLAEIGATPIAPPPRSATRAPPANSEQRSHQPGDPDGKGSHGSLPAMIKKAALYINTPTSNNATFQVVEPLPLAPGHRQNRLAAERQRLPCAAGSTTTTTGGPLRNLQLVRLAQYADAAQSSATDRSWRTTTPSGRR